MEPTSSEASIGVTPVEGPPVSPRMRTALVAVVIAFVIAFAILLGGSDPSDLLQSNDQFGHMAFFGLIALLLMIERRTRLPTIDHARLVWRACIAAAGLVVAAEVVQGFLPERTASADDFYAGMAGVLIGGVVGYLLMQRLPARVLTLLAVGGGAVALAAAAIVGSALGENIAVGAESCRAAATASGDTDELVVDFGQPDARNCFATSAGALAAVDGDVAYDDQHRAAAFASGSLISGPLQPLVDAAIRADAITMAALMRVPPIHPSEPAQIAMLFGSGLKARNPMLRIHRRGTRATVDVWDAATGWETAAVSYPHAFAPEGWQTAGPNTDGFHLVAVVIETDIARFFVDGEQVGEVVLETPLNGILDDADAKLLIGNDHTGTRQLVGHIRSALVAPEALTHDQIAAALGVRDGQ